MTTEMEARNVLDIDSDMRKPEEAMTRLKVAGAHNQCGIAGDEGQEFKSFVIKAPYSRRREIPSGQSLRGHGTKQRRTWEEAQAWAMPKPTNAKANQTNQTRPDQTRPDQTKHAMCGHVCFPSETERTRCVHCYRPY